MTMFRATTTTTAAAGQERQTLMGAAQETALPWVKVALIGLILFCNTFGMVVVFPFLPFMTHGFYPNLHKRELGYMTGYLGSAFSMGSFCAAYIWGNLADRFGRKPVLLSGLFGTLVSIIAFGCSTTFECALSTRFMWGFLNGNIGVAKTYLAEVLDETNQARGFAIIGMQAGIGRLLGPAIGGILSHPAQRYACLNTALFQSYPYLLPCLLAAGLAGLGLIGTSCFLDETLVDTGLASAVSFRPVAQYYRTTQCSEPEKVTLWDLLRTRKILVSTMLYGLIASIGIMSNEVLPLWLLNAPDDGGFSFSTAEIGYVYTVSAPLEILYQVVVFPKIASSLGPLCFLRGALLTLGVMLFILPFTSAAAAAATTTVKWVVLCSAVCLTTLSRLSCFTNVFVLINSSTTRPYRARVNGIGQTMAAAARIVSPALCATLFAWSEGNGLPFPLNFHFVFLLASLLAFLTYRLSTQLPRSPSCAKQHPMATR